MSVPVNKMLFISMSDVANGAENVLLMAAGASNAPMIFLKKSDNGALQISENTVCKYASQKSMAAGFLKLIKLLIPYRRGYVLMSTHPYLNAYLGVLKRIGYLKSQLVVRECTSVFSRYSGLKKMSYRIAYQLGYPAVNLVVCQTDQMKMQFLQNIPFIDSRKVIVLGNPLDINQTIHMSQLTNSDPCLTTDYICAAGRLIPEKGFSVLINAFSRIAEKYPGLNLLLLGDGPEKKNLKRLIATCGLEDRIFFKGWVSNPLPYFKLAKVCVVSSIKEGFPNVLLQMLTINTVVVSTLCAGGINDIPGIFKVAVNNVDELADTLKLALLSKGKPNSCSTEKYLQGRDPKTYVNSILEFIQ
ncbi:glycosyltransferase [Mucilaginibacter sp.]|uniref:glycosyltransferase n=1 Tax=Mucilaginibacter sp. TaxID=1882438 RepID=UPI0026035764|nr:glycosyltransferase [Mucilaginibacter sp.]MDB5029404.1 hypothetical protein [Mucilaginibacter sp.]